MYKAPNFGLSKCNVCNNVKLFQAYFHAVREYGGRTKGCPSHSIILLTFSFLKLVAPVPSFVISDHFIFTILNIIFMLRILFC